MLEIFEFIFSDFWTWLGTAILLAIIATPIRITKVVSNDKGDEK